MLLRLFQAGFQFLHGAFETRRVQASQHLTAGDMFAFIDGQFGNTVLDHKGKLDFPHIDVAVQGERCTVLLPLSPVAVTAGRGADNQDQDQNPHDAFFNRCHKLLPFHDVFGSLAEFGDHCLSPAGQSRWRGRFVARQAGSVAAGRLIR